MAQVETLEMAPLDTVLDELGSKKGALIPILQQAQAIFGYLPAEVLEHISKRTRISLSRSTAWSPSTPSFI